MNDAYCEECHADVHDGWAHSVHRFSSFNNPPYLFSVREKVLADVALRREAATYEHPASARVATIRWRPDAWTDQLFARLNFRSA